jgi:CheY-like chemotaxis protein
MRAIAICGNAPGPRSRTILVVEDEVLVRLALAETLRDEGFSVVEAANADEAIAVLSSSTSIDVVLTDVNMPGSRDGIALGRYARATWPDLKVIVVSGRVAPSGVAGAADAFLAKPYDPQNIVRIIEKLLPGRSE